MRFSCTPDIFVTLIEPFNERSAQTIPSSCFAEDSYLWANLKKIEYITVQFYGINLNNSNNNKTGGISCQN